MIKPLRAFLMIRGPDGVWSVSVHRDLKSVLVDWKGQADSDRGVGVLHVGFDRPPSREFDALADQFGGRMLLTAAARFGLPEGFEKSAVEVGRAGDLPVYLATRGWGYIVDVQVETTLAPEPRGYIVDEQAETTSVPEPRELDGWIKDFASEFPDLSPVLQKAGIFDDQDYLAAEARMDVSLRRQMGMFRADALIGADPLDPCALARVAPPWLAERSFSSMGLPVRASNVFVRCRIETVCDLGEHRLCDLLDTPNFGRKSAGDVLTCLRKALERGPISVETEISEAADVTLLEGIRSSLMKYSNRERDIVLRRMGLDGAAETLQEIAESYQITRERVRQIEAKTVKRLIREEFWDDLLSRKLQVLLRGREFPLPVLGIEAADPWFAGISQFRDALVYMLTNICEGDADIVTVDSIDYFAFLDQERWDATVAEGRRLLASGVGKQWSIDHCRSLVYALLPESAAEFRTLLWEKASRLCHFSQQGHGPQVLTSCGRGVEQIVEALLKSAERPLHFTEIAALAGERANRSVDVRRAHGAAASVGLLLGRGIYGLDQHLPVNAETLEVMADVAEEIVAEGPAGRQWHTSEILAALREGDVAGADQVNRFVVDIALSRSGGLKRLGRMVWTEFSEQRDDEVRRIDLRQATIALLQQAGRPLKSKEIQQRLIALRGINRHFQIHGGEPLIRVGTSLWGLNDRDLPVKRAQQNELLNAIVAELDRREFGLHASEIAEYIQLASILPTQALFGLATTDPRLRVGLGQYLYLAKWGEPRRETISDAVETVLALAPEPLSLEAIIYAVESRIRRRCDKRTVTACLQALEAMQDDTSGEWSLRQSAREDAGDCEDDIGIGAVDLT